MLGAVVPDPHVGQRLVRSGIAVSLISLVGMAAGTAVQLLVAWFYGAGSDADAFVVATTLPLYLQAVIVGALGIVMVPALSQARVRRGHSAATWLAAHLSLRLMLMLGIVSILGVLYAEPLIRFTTPGLASSGAVAAARIARLLWPTLCALGVGTVFVALLQLEGHFIWPALLPVLGSSVNAGLIVVGSPRWGIDAVAIGTLASALLQIAVLAWLCWPRVRNPGTESGLGREAALVLAASVPLVLSGLLVRITPVVDRYLASAFPEGTIAHLGYAFRLVTVAPGLFTVGLGAVLFPRMSLSVARDQMDDLRRTLSTGLAVMFTFCVPTVLFGMILAPDAVRILLQRGAFNVDDTAAVAQAIRLYLPALVAIVLSVVTARAIYALKELRLIAAIGAVESVVYVAYTYALVKVVGWQGIALGFTAYNLLSLVWQIVYLRVRLGAVVGRGTGLLLGRTLGAGAGAAFIVWAVTRTPSSPWAHVFVGALAGIVCYATMLRITRSPELRTILGLLPRVFTKPASVPPPVQG